MEEPQIHFSQPSLKLERPLLVTKGRTVRCGQASEVLSVEVQDWLKQCLGCVAGRREFLSNRYFAVEVRELADVIGGWRHFMRALERRETVACLYVIPQPESPQQGAKPSALESMTAVAEVMSVLSDQTPRALLEGGQLNFVIHLPCPVTECRAAFGDFDAVAFVPQAEDPRDPLYDPLMAAPVPMVNINSDIYGFSMFTRDHTRGRFDCEIRHLTRRERRYIFGHAADIWQRMAERTINNYARMVDQSLCPTYLTADRDFWIANHKDPAFAEVEKKPHLHEMPVHYTRRVIEAWEAFFETGKNPTYSGIAAEGQPPQCPHHRGRSGA